MIAILDYGAGNLASVDSALKHLGIPCQITAEPEKIQSASGIIFPGVGNASQAMAKLKETRLDKVLADAITRKQPLLGICLGCQILLEHSEEGPTETLGLIKGNCRRFEDNLHEENGFPINIPHIGWNSLCHKQDSPLFKGIPDDAEFYFVHSYYACPQEDMVISTTFYGREFCSVYGKDGLWATQFHPEKSGQAGLRLLQNFYNWCNHAL